MELKHIDLYSGLGGFALACEWLGIETILFCEIDPFCQKVLKKHWPDVPIVKDVNNVEEIKRIIANTQGIHGKGYGSQKEHGQAIRQSGGLSLILTAGFPCQPFSAAGRRKGSADDRYLWPQTLAVIESIKPNWVLLENVAGILSMVFPDSAVGVASQASFCEVPNDEIADYNTISGRIDGDLRQAGYETVWLVIPACAVGAPHRRDRVWIVAHDDSALYRPREQQVCTRRDSVKLCNKDVANSHQSYSRSQEQCRKTYGENIQRPPSGASRPDSDVVANPTEQRLQRAITERAVSGGYLAECNHIPGWSENWHEVATRFCRVDDGIPRVVDRVERLKALGNAIVPEVAYQIIRVIKVSQKGIGI